MSDLLWVRVRMTINGVECYYVSSVSRQMWGYPEYKLAIIRRLKQKCIDEATRGMEPIVEESDEMPPGLGWGGIPELAHGSEVDITCSSG